MANFPDYMNKTEAQIINRILSAALAHGGKVSVYDGEEWALKQSTDRAAIQAEVAATDMTTLRLRDAKGDTVGSVLLVHGNGADVICDYSDSPAMDAMLANANAYADSLY
jgi:hypothetical protein